MPEMYLPLLKPLPIEQGKDLKVYALNGKLGQMLPPFHADTDAYLSIQQGVLKVFAPEGEHLLQAHEAELLHAGRVFYLEAMNDTRARLVLPQKAQLVFEQEPPEEMGL